jgi:cellobiose epimerase
MNDSQNSFQIEAAWNALPEEMEEELHNILQYWTTNSADMDQGGFVGQINQENKWNKNAAKGSVLNARILWTFSAACLHTRNPAHLLLATRAYEYIREYFTDHERGGLYWSVDSRGEMLDSHKQIYAQAFGIYAMSEYYRASGETSALDLAIEWYRLIEKYSRDQVQGGYIDAFTRDWGQLDDKRLSIKDENASKTMNTHLHVVEAYANLYTIWPSPALKDDIVSLLQLFNEKIIHPDNHHLGLFFSEDWEMNTLVISYGHDIEAAWLLQACAESIGDAESVSVTRKNAIQITDAAMQGLDIDGGLWYEYNTVEHTLVPEKHWWPQAEALIGFCNAWQLTQNPIYKNALLNNWRFIRRFILDTRHGEWIWGIDENKKQMQNQDKIGIWKCPYHNTRACLELIRRFSAKTVISL